MIGLDGRGWPRIASREAQRDFISTDEFEISIKNTGLKEGTHRIVVELALSLSISTSTTQPELRTSLNGGLLQVY